MAKLWTQKPAALELRRRSWDAFVADPTTAQTAAALRRHIGHVACVIDAGCGAGQELLAYVPDPLCVGVDTDREALALGRGLFRDQAASVRVALTCAAVEALPLRPRCADVVISRVVLQRVLVRPALAEMARVLRPGGGLVVTFHHPRYYLRKLSDGMRAGDLRPIVHALRVLLTGLCFHLSGTQRSILGVRETYLTRGRLQRMAAAVGLDFAAALDHGSAAAPTLLFRRRDG